MKTKQYCIVENHYGDLKVHTFDYTMGGQILAETLFDELAKSNGIYDDIKYNWVAFNDPIAFVCLGNSRAFNLTLIVSR